MKTIWRPPSLWLVPVPILSALLASACFAAQGGFGGGHGPADLVIGILGLSSVALLNHGLPVPQALESSDLLAIIWYPALINLLCFWGPLACLLAFLGRGRRKREVVEL